MLWQFVNNETNDFYQQSVKEIVEKGFKVDGIVADGRSGILKAFGKIPVQMCHFHQTKIVQRYITLNPRLKASVEL